MIADRGSNPGDIWRSKAHQLKIMLKYKQGKYPEVSVYGF